MIAGAVDTQLKEFFRFLLFGSLLCMTIVFAMTRFKKFGNMYVDALVDK